MARTALYKRLPPDSGTPFNTEIHLSGFRDIKIESRAAAERHIKEFLKYCENDAEQPAARMIIGAWGEGKTEAFTNFIQPWATSNKHKAFLIPSRSIANAYPGYRALDVSEARLFLASVFHVLHNDGIEGIPAYSMGGTEQWISECLEALGCRKRKLFLFVDEVEQLLHEQQDLRSIMVGIKHILDGAIPSLLPGSPFAGSLFVFLACTPEAYNRISTDPDMRQVFGGYARRMDKINIEPVSAVEAVQFVHDLLRYSYEGKLPQPMPVSSPGILVALTTIAKKNLGNMVSLTSRLLSSVQRSDRHLDVIDPDVLRQFAIGKTVTIEGNETKCFEESLYDQVMQRIDELRGVEAQKRLFTAMLFDQRAFSTTDVIQVFGQSAWKGFEAIWAEFLKDALTESYPPGLLSFYRVNGTLGLETLFNNLDEYEDKHNVGSFQIAERTFSKRELHDLLVDWTFDGKGMLEQQLLIPANLETVNLLFGPLPYQEAQSLLDLFVGLKGEGEILYRLPQDLIDTLFPPPSPPGLEFIQAPSDRFNLWRRATIEFSEKLSQDLPNALTVFARRTESKPWYFADAETQDLGSRIFAASLIYEREFPQKRAAISTWILVRSRVIIRDIEQCEKLLDSSGSLPPHLILFLSNDPVAPDVLSRIPAKIRNRACFVNIHPTYAKQMLASYWHIKADGPVWPEVLARTREVLLERDLRFYARLDEWLSRGRNFGFVVDNPALSEGTHKGLVNGLRLLLNAQGSGRTLREIFDWNRNDLRRLIPYGSKSGLVPETDRLESYDGFRAIVGDLQTNSLVSIDTNNKPSLSLSPCENLILSDLSLKEIDKDAWNQHLVILSTPESIVEDLYVEALIQRGLVKRVAPKKTRARVGIKSKRIRIGSEEIRREALNKVAELGRRVEALSQGFPQLSFIAHVAGAKERDIQIITLDDVQAIINHRLDAINNPQDDLELHANAFFLIRFLEETGELLLNSTRLTKEILQTIPQRLRASYNEYLSQTLPNVLSGLPQLIDLAIETESLEELKELRTVVEEAENLIKDAEAKVKDDVREKLLLLEPDELKKYFWFSDVDSQQFPHNYYAFKAKQIEEQFQTKANSFGRLVTNIKGQIEGPNERRARLYRQLISFQLVPSAVLSKKILDALKFPLQPRAGQNQLTASGLRVNSLKGLWHILEDRTPDISSSVAVLEKSVEIWERINSGETLFLNALDNSYKKLESAKAKFNLPDCYAALNGLEELVKDAERLHDNLCTTTRAIDPDDLDHARRELSKLNEHLEAIDTLIESDLWKPFVEKRSAIMRRIGKRMAACKALNALPEELYSKFLDAEQSFTTETSLADFLNKQRTCRDELTILEDLRAQARTVMDGHLNHEEKILLTTILDLYTESDSEGTIDLDKLRERVPANIKILEVAESLWHKGIISIRLSL